MEFIDAREAGDTRGIASSLKCNLLCYFLGHLSVDSVQCFGQRAIVWAREPMLNHTGYDVMKVPN